MSGRLGSQPSRMLGNGHVRLGRRAATTDQSKDPHRAAARPHSHVSTWSGWCYTAFAIDACARRILGWPLETTMPSPLVQLWSSANRRSIASR